MVGHRQVPNESRWQTKEIDVDSLRGLWRIDLNESQTLRLMEERLR